MLIDFKPERRKFDDSESRCFTKCNWKKPKTGGNTARSNNVNSIGKMDFSC